MKIQMLLFLVLLVVAGFAHSAEIDLNQCLTGSGVLEDVSGTWDCQPLSVPEPDPIPPPTGALNDWAVATCSNGVGPLRWVRDNSNYNIRIDGGEENFGGCVIHTFGATSGRAAKCSTAYNTRNADQGADAVLFFMCDGPGGQISESQTLGATDFLRGGVSLGAPVYVTTLNVGHDATPCSVEGYQNTVDLTRFLVNGGHVNGGRTISGQELLQPNSNEVQERDNCHPSSVGSAKTGQQLLDFINSVQP